MTRTEDECLPHLSLGPYKDTTSQATLIPFQGLTISHLQREALSFSFPKFSEFSIQVSAELRASHHANRPAVPQHDDATAEAGGRGFEGRLVQEAGRMMCI